MDELQEVILMGEDIREPYGGTFKVARGLAERFSNRIINMPISEAGFIGLGIGMAMNGLKSVVEIMFGDFITLGFDQILNHATKFRWMYAEQITVPSLIRVPMGERRGYGATHSQSLEKYLTGVPNLRVVALSKLLNSRKLVYHILKNLDSPVVLVENKKMYGEKLSVADTKIKLIYLTLLSARKHFLFFA